MLGNIYEVVGYLWGCSLVLGPVIGFFVAIICLCMSAVYLWRGISLLFGEDYTPQPQAAVVRVPLERPPVVKPSKKKASPPMVSTFSEEFKLPGMPFS